MSNCLIFDVATVPHVIFVFASKAKRFGFFLSPTVFQKNAKFGAKNILQTSGQLIQFSYLLLSKEPVLVYSLSEPVAAKGNSQDAT